MGHSRGGRPLGSGRQLPPQLTVGRRPLRGGEGAQSGGQNQKKAHRWARWLHTPIGRLWRPSAPWVHTFDN